MFLWSWYQKQLASQYIRCELQEPEKLPAFGLVVIKLSKQSAPGNSEDNKRLKLYSSNASSYTIKLPAENRNLAFAAV